MTPLDALVPAIDVLRRYNALLVAQGREPITAESLRALDPAWFARMEALAPGMAEDIMAAIAGDAEAARRVDAMLVPGRGAVH